MNTILQQPAIDVPTALDSMKFFRNWNNKILNHFFTTIRLDSDKWQAGKYYKVETPLGFAFRGLVHDKKVLTLAQLPAITLALDLGMRADDARNTIASFYPQVKDWNKQPICVLLVENMEYYNQELYK